MISHEYNCIFIHVPKTAGVSIYKLFDSQEQHHVTLDYYPDDYVRDYFKFAFVRNPYDRIVSAFHYFKAGGRKLGKDEATQELLKPYPQFEDFIVDFPDLADQFESVHFQPQVNWIQDEDGNNLMDFVGKYEKLHKDLFRIMKKIGMKRQIVPWLNRSMHGHYRKYYNSHTKKIIQGFYGQDLDAFKYRF